MAESVPPSVTRGVALTPNNLVGRSSVALLGMYNTHSNISLRNLHDNIRVKYA